MRFKSLGAVVIDEQHRFGVEQRAALRQKGEGEDGTGRTPDVLVMTATPIPRTAAMTVYGDLDVSVLDELPPGRTPIRTQWANGPLLEAVVWGDVRSEVEAGRQAYVVCPLIEESEKLEVASAEETYERLVHGELAGLRIGLLHGRLPSAEKDAVMERFRRADLDVLVATTVIEVGVDVPNATVMVILDADRFGIAQLHQLRGRVGRAHHVSRCWLVTAESPEGNARVEALVASTDGFELAEVDLDLRGEGTLMNTAQKGRNDLKLASLRRDRELVVARPGGGVHHRRPRPRARRSARPARRARPVVLRRGRSVPVQELSTLSRQQGVIADDDTRDLIDEASVGAGVDARERRREDHSPRVVQRNEVGELERRIRSGCHDRLDDPVVAGDPFRHLIQVDPTGRRVIDALSGGELSERAAGATTEQDHERHVVVVGIQHVERCLAVIGCRIDQHERPRSIDQSGAR